jgi:hypothetical protein
MTALIRKEILVQLKRVGTSTYFKLKTNYREKQLKDQKKISQLRMAILTGSIRRVK